MEKRFEYQERQKEVQEKWKREQTFNVKNNPGPLYSIDTPPPTISGSLHIGHIFSYSQTDIIARYKRMNGYCVFYPFGFDDNGLPTERFVEKKLKVRAHDMSRSEFIKLCLQQTKEIENKFKDLWQQIGLSVDWNACYSTISEPVRKLSQESFIELLKKGYIYRKNEPALYCTTCRTSVAQAELDDKELDSFFNDIIFTDQDSNQLVIGTTRPELLPSCVALFYNPKDDRYQKLENKRAIVPIFGHEIPIYADERVEIEKGTGLVMCCTFGDKTDIEWFKAFKLPYKQSIDLNGKWKDDTGILAGLKAQDARKVILEELEKKKLLVRQKPITHAVNVHERCKKEIEFVMLPQWFLNLLDYKKEFIKLAEQIDWYPAFMKKRYINWVENLSWDWCLSRQRFYGIPFPVWFCGECDEVLVPDFDELPVDPQEDTINCCIYCGSEFIVPDTDVMDTWNTSSLTPYICYELYLQKPVPRFFDEKVIEFLPMGMRPQAHDIIRTWAFYTIVKTWMHNKTTPWKEIIISGHVLSEKKEKLSKSKEQKALSPEHLLQQYPADAIRYWTASGGLGHDIAFSESQLKIGKRLITKIWNAFRFAEPHIANLDSIEDMPEQFGLLNESLLDKATTCFTSYQNYFEKHEFSLALDQIEGFFWHTFCDNYLELIKHQLFNPDEYTKEEVYATRYTLYDVGLRILQMYSPYLPFITETIYGLLYQKRYTIPSIAQTKFEKVQQDYVFSDSKKIVDHVIELITKIRKLKTEKQLSLKTPLASLIIYTQDMLFIDNLKQLEKTVKGVTQAQEIIYKEIKGSKHELSQKDGLWHAHVTME